LSASYRGWGIAFALAGVVSFAFRPVLIKLGYSLAPVSATTLLFLRMTLSLPFFAAIAWWFRRRGPAAAPISGNDWLGIVGLGRIGQAVARRARPFGLRLLYAQRNRLPAPDEQELDVEYRPLDALLAEADLASLHVPLTAETRSLIDARRLALLRDGASLINTARGDVVDQDALVRELLSGRIRAGLDVFHQEPLAPDDPILSLPNVVCSPHNAGQTPEVIRDGLLRAVENVEHFLRGRPRDVVVAPVR